MSPPHKNFIHETLGGEDDVPFGEPADREAEQLIAEQQAEAAEQTRREPQIGDDDYEYLKDVKVGEPFDDELGADDDNEPPPAESPDDNGSAGEQAGDARKDRFELYALDEIVVGNDPIELVRGILPMGPALAVVLGPPKSLKSFLLAHVGIHIAGDILFCGREVQAGAVCYVTSEGVKGTARRLVAERRALGVEGKGVPFFLVPAMPNLGAGAADRERLAKKVRAKIKDLGVPLRMLVIDTMRRSMPGKSENEQKDVSLVIDNCEALSREFGCLVVLVHHSPRSDDDRGSGSNAVDAAADAMIGVKRDPATKIATATVLRLKDGEEGDAWSFELRPIEVGVDRDGRPIVSRYVQITEEPERNSTTAKAHVKLSAEQQRIYDILLEAVAAQGIVGLAGSMAPPGILTITRATLVEYLKRGGWWDKEKDHSSRSKISARLNELAGKHAIGLTEQHVWPVFN